jgi:DNA-binding SARP family transcriptional activator/Flp pilus assembly protein TadD
MTAIQFLGGATLHAHGAPVTGPAAQRHRVALLALVAASWPQALGRDRAMALLWPESEPERARRLLNLAVHVLRRALGEELILTAGDGLLFQPDQVVCDLHAFRTSRGDAAAATYGGPFLDGFHLPDAPDFHFWLDEQRTSLARAFEAALLEHAGRQRDAGDVHGVVATCRRLAAADPFSGPHARALMLALEGAGDRAGALRHAQEHERRLRTELDLDPDAETTALLQRLLSHPAKPASLAAAAAPARSGAAVPLLALVFDDRSEGVAGHVAADLRERIVERLLLGGAVRVAAAGTRIHRVGEPTERPRADAVLDTQVTLDGAAVLLRLRLVDAAAGVFLLSTRLRAPLASLDTLADDAARAVINALAGRRSPSHIPVADDEVDEARMLCAKGQHFCARREETALRRAIACFEQARTLAPTYAPAYTGLANAYAILGFYDLLPPREAFPLARQAAQTARALNPAEPDCHTALGYIAKYFDWHWSTAEQELQDAIALDPQNPLAHQWFGNYLALRGRLADAVTSMNRAVRLAPHSAIATAATGWAHYFAGDYHRTLDLCAAASELDPHLPVAHSWRAQAAQELGRHEEAIAALRSAVALSPTSAAVEADLAQALARAGADDEARALVRRLAASRRTRYVPPYEIAKVHLALGDRQRALRYLETALLERSHSIGFLRVDPQLAPLREEPRFRRLLARAGHG